MDEQTLLNQHSTPGLENAHTDTAYAIRNARGSGDVRRNILLAATNLFSASGYHGVSVRQIVEAVGISKPTLYYYFPSKEQLFKRIILDSLEDFRGQLQREVARPGTIRQRLIRICQVHLDFAQRNTEECRLTYSVYFSSERNVIDFDFNAYFRRNFEMIGDVITEGIASSELRAADPTLMVFNFVGIINLFIMGMLYDPAEVAVDGLAEQIVDLTLEGMARPVAENQGGPQ